MSSGIDGGTMGSDTGAVIEMVSDTASPVSQLDSLLALGRRKLTTRVRFLRRLLECFPEPRVSPVVAELRLAKEGLVGNEP